MNLNLTIKKQWFDMINSGEKLQEYREIKPYWFERLVFQHERVFAYCTGLSYNSIITRQQGIDHIVQNKRSMFGFKPFDTVTFKNGYSKTAPTLVMKCEGIEIGLPISGLCEEGWLDTNVFIIKLTSLT